MRTTLLPLLALSIAGLACTGVADPPAPPPPDPAPVAAEPDADPAKAKHRKAKSKGKKGGGEEAPGPAPAGDLVAAYVADCHHVVAPELDEFEENKTDDECTFRPFDQNCGPDPFGCWGDAESCKDGCGKPCVGCQDKCAAVCDDCKSSCSGQGDACVTRCAEARASCRDTCLGGKEKCEGDCGLGYNRCETEGQKNVTAKCPDCEAMNTCLWKKISAQEPTEGCLAEVPGHAPECLQWCFQQ